MESSVEKDAFDAEGVPDELQEETKLIKDDKDGLQMFGFTHIHHLIEKNEENITVEDEEGGEDADDDEDLEGL